MSENFTVQITSRREAIQAAFLLPKILARQSASPVIGLFFFASMAPQPEQHQVGKNAGSP